MTGVVETEALTRRFGPVAAGDRVSLSVAASEVGTPPSRGPQRPGALSALPSMDQGGR